MGSDKYRQAANEVQQWQVKLNIVRKEVLTSTAKYK